MVSLLSRFVLTPEPCKFLHNFRGKGLEPCYASLVKKKATPVLTWLLTLAKICGTRANSTVTEFERLIRVNGLQGGGGGKKNDTYLHTSAVRAMQYWSKNQSGINCTQLELFII